MNTEELARAMTVWLRVMPKQHVWRELERFEKAAAEKRQMDEGPDVHGTIARYISGQFVKIGWSVTAPEARNIFADRTSSERASQSPQDSPSAPSEEVEPPTADDLPTRWGSV